MYCLQRRHGIPREGSRQGTASTCQRLQRVKLSSTHAAAARLHEVKAMCSPNEHTHTQMSVLEVSQHQLRGTDLHEVKLAAQGVVDQPVGGKVVGVLRKQSGRRKRGRANRLARHRRRMRKKRMRRCDSVRQAPLLLRSKGCVPEPGFSTCPATQACTCSSETQRLAILPVQVVQAAHRPATDADDWLIFGIRSWPGGQKETAWFVLVQAQCRAGHDHAAQDASSCCHAPAWCPD